MGVQSLVCCNCLNKGQIISESGHLCLFCLFVWACCHACAFMHAVCFGHTVRPLLSNRSPRGTVKQAQGQKWCEKAEKGREKAQNQDFYGNKCRWKCGFPISSQMPSYLGKLLGRPRCFAYDDWSTRKQHWAEQPVTVWSVHSSYGRLRSTWSGLIGSTVSVTGVPARPLHYIKTANDGKGFSLTVRRISFIFSHNLSVRSSWYELIDSFCFRLNPFMSVFSLFLSCFIFSSSFLVQICAVEFYFYFCLGKNQQIILILFYNFIARLQNKHRVAMLVWFWRLPVALPLWPPPNPGAGDGPGVRAALRPTGEGPSRAGATAFERFGASAGGGGLLCPAGHLQGQAGGRVQQPPQRRGRAGERPDWCRARQTGRFSFIFF